MLIGKKKKQALEIVPYEDNEQKTLFEWAEMWSKKYPELKLLYHVPNGDWRHPATARKLKEMGVKSGVPDLVLPVARGVYHGLFIELKRCEGGRLTDNQKRWIEDLVKQGYFATVCRGWDSARDTIEMYLNLRENER